MKRDFRPVAGSFLMPDEIRHVSLSNITVGKRERRIDQAKVEQLAQSIKTQGLLQPIGVQRQQSGFRLLFGAHRLAAMALLNETDVTADGIGCMIFSQEMEEWASPPMVVWLGKYLLPIAIEMSRGACAPSKGCSLFKALAARAGASLAWGLWPTAEISLVGDDAPAAAP
jgi:hypothetical protein